MNRARARGYKYNQILGLLCVYLVLQAARFGGRGTRQAWLVMVVVMLHGETRLIDARTRCGVVTGPRT